MFADRFFRFRLGGLIAIILVIRWGWLSFSAQAQPRAPEILTWEISVIDSSGDVGFTTSLALQPGTDKPYISYYDSTNGDQKLAFPVSGGGDCGPGNTWSCNSLAFPNMADFGVESSLDINSLGQWGIVYSNSTTGSTDFRGIPAAWGQEIFFDPIEQGAPILTFWNTMRFDQADVSHISYGFVDINQGNGYIKHAKYVGLGGNCGDGLWQCDIVAQTSTAEYGMFNSLALYGATPYIFYRDFNQQLALAANKPGNCGPNNDWDCIAIDPVTIIEGPMSAYINASEFYVAVAYIGDGSLRYAQSVTTGTGNCGGFSFNYQCDTIDSVGLADNNQWMAASLGEWNGQPIIAYTDTDDRNNAVLKVAYPETNGNCGPLDTNLQPTWRCSVIDGSATGNARGYYPSLQVDSEGRIHIAYYDFTAGDLKYALSDAPINPTATPTSPSATGPPPVASHTPTPTATTPPGALVPRVYLPLITR